LVQIAHAKMVTSKIHQPFNANHVIVHVQLVLTLPQHVFPVSAIPIATSTMQHVHVFLAITTLVQFHVRYAPINAKHVQTLPLCVLHVHKLIIELC
jgi:hypothetical protein